MQDYFSPLRAIEYLFAILCRFCRVLAALVVSKECKSSNAGVWCIWIGSAFRGLIERLCLICRLLNSGATDIVLVGLVNILDQIMRKTSAILTFFFRWFAQFIWRTEKGKSEKRNNLRGTVHELFIGATADRHEAEQCAIAWGQGGDQLNASDACWESYSSRSIPHRWNICGSR